MRLHRTCRLSAFVWMVCLVRVWGVESDVDLAAPVQPPVEISPDSPTGEKLDGYRAWAFEWLDTSVQNLDAYFGEDDPARPPEHSSFKLQLYFTVEQSGGTSFSIDPSIDGRLNLPNLETRLHIFVDTISPDDLPGLSASERDHHIETGLRGSLLKDRKLYLHTGGGVKWRLPPVVFGEAKIGRDFEIEDWKLNLEQQFFWYSDDGFGEQSRMQWDRKFTPRVPFRSQTGVKWTETTDGVEWSQVFRTGYIIEEHEQAIGTQAAVFGHKNGAGVIDKYRWSVTYRTRIYKHWLYLEITPQFDFPRDRHYELTPSIQFGLDAFLGVDQAEY